MARILPNVGALYKEARTATGAPTGFDERRPTADKRRNALEAQWANPAVVAQVLDVVSGTGKNFYDKYQRVQEAKAQVIAGRTTPKQRSQPAPTGTFSLGGVGDDELKRLGITTMAQAATAAAGADSPRLKKEAMGMAEGAIDRPGSYRASDYLVGGPDARREELIKKLYPPAPKASGGGYSASRPYKPVQGSALGSPVLTDLREEKAGLAKKLAFLNGDPSATMVLEKTSHAHAFDAENVKGNQVVVISPDRERMKALQEPASAAGKEAARSLIRESESLKTQGDALQARMTHIDGYLSWYHREVTADRGMGTTYGKDDGFARVQNLRAKEQYWVDQVATGSAVDEWPEMGATSSGSEPPDPIQRTKSDWEESLEKEDAEKEAEEVFAAKPKTEAKTEAKAEDKPVEARQLLLKGSKPKPKSKRKAIGGRQRQVPTKGSRSNLLEGATPTGQAPTEEELGDVRKSQ